jgi:4-diphosphocytidyl-2-C-methyl-D-erythritol kinase
MPTREFKCPAKINLCLLVRGRRDDGYHLLESLVAPISLYDDVRVDFEEVGETRIDITSNSSAAPADSSNLAYKAASLVLRELDHTAHVRIALRKNIPVGSGLGGGSSNAAGVLHSLNTMLGNPLGIDQLLALGLKLGADVPLFIRGGTSIMEGIGEKLTAVRLPETMHLVLCSDGVSISTKDVFRQVDITLTSGNRPSNIRRFVSGEAALSELLHNDLELPAAKIHPSVLQTKKRLLDLGAMGALMTGSGSAIFGVFENCPAAESAAVVMQRNGYWAEAVHTLE